VVLTEEEMLLLFGNDAPDPSSTKLKGDESSGGTVPGHISPNNSINGMQLRRR